MTTGVLEATAEVPEETPGVLEATAEVPEETAGVLEATTELLDFSPTVILVAEGTSASLLPKKCELAGGEMESPKVNPPDIHG